MSTPDHTKNLTSEAPPFRRPSLVLAFLSMAGFMTFLDVSIVNVALPTIEEDLNVPSTYLPYIVTTYGMMLGGFLLLCGRLADYFGRRLMLQIGLVVFALTSLTAGLATDAMMLIISRGVQGLGAAFIATAALSLLRNSFAEGAERNRALGVWGALSGIAAVAGVTLGGLLTDGPGWAWVFFINVPIGLGGALAAPFILRESRSTEQRRSFDVMGGIVLTTGLVLLIFSLGQTVDDQDVDPFLLYGGFAAAALLLLAFLFIEWRSSSPLVPLGIFRRPMLRSANIVALLLLGNTVTLFFFASLFMQQVLEYSPIRTGLAYLPLAVLTAVGAGIASNVVTRVAAKPVLLVGLTLTTTGMLLLWRLPADGSYLIDILPAFVVTGLGLGLSFVPLQISAFAGTTERESGLAAGLINTSQEVGGALGLAVAAAISFRNVSELTAAAAGDPDLIRAARVTVFHEAFLIGAGFLVAAFLATLVLLPFKRTSEQTDASAPVA
jgi:EmrB/QacA subfamily drug resistance transporter